MPLAGMQLKEVTPVKGREAVAALNKLKEGECVGLLFKDEGVVVVVCKVENGQYVVATKNER
ncbi:MAG: hypothetical protein DRJ52_09450 [Thermoprotei archaeon]|nr:MAG: hypothetical protein DRJ52_09450 [Thermoprotei archaeon]HDD33816.1 hypothetical protein [Thermofilaceae archaeon]